jgi:hypothetical protein
MDADSILIAAEPRPIRYYLAPSPQSTRNAKIRRPQQQASKHA